MTGLSGASPVIRTLDAFVDDLEYVHAQAATAWATEMQVLAQVPDLVRRREAATH